MIIIILRQKVVAIFHLNQQLDYKTSEKGDLTRHASKSCKLFHLQMNEQKNESKLGLDKLSKGDFGVLGILFVMLSATLMK